MKFLYDSRNCDVYAEWGVFVQYSQNESGITWFGSNRQAAKRFAKQQEKDKFPVYVVREVIEWDK